MFRIDRAIEMRVFHYISIAIFALNAIAVPSLGNGISAIDRPEVSDPWRGPQFDGVNGLYLLLRLMQKNVTRSDVQNQLPANEKSISMADLQVAADHFGQQLVFCRCPPEQLATMPMPALLHIESSDESKTKGAFWLLLSIDMKDRACTLIEPGRAGFDSWEVDKLARNWSGFALVPRPPVTQRTFRLILFVAIVGCAAAAVLLVTHITRYYKQIRYSRCVAEPLTRNRDGNAFI